VIIVIKTPSQPKKKKFLYAHVFEDVLARKETKTLLSSSSKPWLVRSVPSK